MKGELLKLRARISLFRALSRISEKRRLFLLKLIQNLENEIKKLEEEKEKEEKKLIPKAFFNFVFIYEKPHPEFDQELQNYWKLLNRLEDRKKELEKRQKELEKFSRLENALEEFMIPRTIEKMREIKRRLEEKELEEIALRIVKKVKERTF